MLLLTLTPAVQPRPAVLAMAEAMEARLRTFDERRGVEGWLQDSPRVIVARLQQQIQGLRIVAIERPCGCRDAKACSHMGALVEVQQVAADVANLAMMVADVFGALEDLK